MEIYLVGGAVRDQLLGLPVQEKDYVVVGATPEALLAQKFQPVGKEFPVFLHPVTKEEYALARTERKVAKGYKGFQFYASPEVTLEQDLLRRDLTINAMAMDDHGRLIDPYHGQQDLQHKILRHVSLAFAEDPVRILRVARFAAKLPEFTVHQTTNQLMQAMVSAGEVNALVAERVWKEFSRALLEKEPWRFFEVLENCQALPILFPKILSLTELKAFFVQAKAKKLDSIVLFALIWQDLSALKVFQKQYRIPKDFFEMAVLLLKFFEFWKENVDQLNAKNILNLLLSVDAFRRPERFLQFLQACEIKSNNKCIESQVIDKALQACASIDNQVFLKKGLLGQAFAEALNQERLRVIQALLNKR